MMITKQTNSRRWLPVLALAMLGALCLQSPAGAQEGLITPNYREADIRQVIDAVQAVTGRSMIVDQRVNAKVTLLSSQPMTAEEFYAAFLSLLQVNNFQAIETGNVTRIIPNAQLRSEPINIGRAAPDETVTTVIRIENVSAAQLVPVLRPLLPNYAHLAAYQSSNTLIISDTQRNIDRIRYLLRQIDRPVEEDVEIVRLVNASAADIVSTISALTNATRAEAAAAGTATNLVADARTNSVLISGIASSRLKIRTLIAHLDTPQEDGGDTQVRYLRYANADDLATKLQGQDLGAPTNPAGGAAAADDAVSIWADELTNALIITAPPATMRSIMAVVDKLDIRRAQVLVEALIVEVTAATRTTRSARRILHRQTGASSGWPAPQAAATPRRSHRRSAKASRSASAASPTAASASPRSSARWPATPRPTSSPRRR